ncbi:hypothetical protein SAMN02799622_03523 [Methylobacterium sp. UNC378MF]|uniref:hypothetical protein n=1 Tax=Methylobacterium sp. UNC378MF TaxID=1502748 RepID=UPI00088406C7|nr:hypothetical protein [Methylobacterium sp. UNC378MF]SDA24972.1 hypothetical protein SAMN02799622_03523 [Methylobacterium sp. UNC378MF]
MTPSTRRAALGAILAAPLASVPSVAAPTSDLAAACNAAAKRWALVTDQSLPAEAFTDEQVDAEIDHCTAVLERCVKEPSQSAQDLAAKARLLIAEHDDGDEFVGHRALIALLNEVVALCG